LKGLRPNAAVAQLSSFCREYPALIITDFSGVKLLPDYQKEE